MPSPENNQRLSNIGYTAREVARKYGVFQSTQTEFDLDHDQLVGYKDELQAGLDVLRWELDGLLANEYGVDAKKLAAFGKWQSSHKPFHWFVEFYGIMSNGGFDVVIGNPPYVEYSKVKSEYSMKGYQTESCGNLYAFVMERCKAIASQKGSLSMIVPLSGHSTKRMQGLVKAFYSSYGSIHLQTIGSDANPSRLFDNVKFRLAIFVASNLAQETFTTRYLRWYAEERPFLFDLLEYTPIGDFRYPTAIPKVASLTHLQILKKLSARPHNFQLFEGRTGSRIYYHSAPVNWVRAHSTVPYFKSERDGEKKSSKLKMLFSKSDTISSLQSILCSTTFLIWWLSNSDCYDLNKPEIVSFPLLYDNKLLPISKKLETDMKAQSKRRVYNYKTTGRVEYDEFYMKLSKPIIDEIDCVLAEHYGFTEEELDFIINYDIKYRMGKEG